MKVNVNNSLLFFILLFIPINLLKDLFPFPATLITGGIILILMCWILLVNITKKQLIIMLIPIVLFIMGLFTTDDVSRHVRYFFNWYSLLCSLIICTSSNRLLKISTAFLENQKKFHNEIRIVAIVFIILLFTPSAYSGGWWGLSNGFTAFTVSHAVSASACTFLIFELLYLQNNQSRKNIIEAVIFFILSIYIIFQTGARIYVISLMVIGIIYLFDVIKSRNIRFLCLLLGIFFVSIIISNSAFAEKNTIVLSYQSANNSGFLDAVTSGRVVIWSIDFFQFIKSGLYTILFGQGFAYSYKINREYYYGFDIFSHNIFLETLLSMGICGLIILLVVIYDVISKYKKNKISMFSLVIYIVIVGFLNGLFDSQIYCYSCLLLVIVIRNRECHSRTIK